jgi:hypothetical protein
MMIAEARENPFETADSAKKVGKATQIDEKREDFVSTTVTLPSTARILKSTTVTFQNLDGSISEEVVAIDQNIDWHQPLVLSVQKAVREETPVPIQKSALAEAIRASSGVQKENPPSAPAPKTDSTPPRNQLKFNDTLSLSVQGNEISIFTKDAKVRDFLIADPYKVVVDFKKTTSFATQTLNINQAPFVSAVLGDHEGFYRIAILLDGHYRYDILPFNGGYIIKLK